MHILTFFLDLFTGMGIKDRNKDLEIVLLRQQLRILQRKGKKPPRISDPERMILATLTNKLRPIFRGCTPEPLSGPFDLQTGHRPWLASKPGSEQVEL
jgi:hypothetical protein